jgi:hypothetical protein
VVTLRIPAVSTASWYEAHSTRPPSASESVIQCRCRVAAQRARLAARKNMWSAEEAIGGDAGTPWVVKGRDGIDVQWRVS